MQDGPEALQRRVARIVQAYRRLAVHTGRDKSIHIAEQHIKLTAQGFRAAQGCGIGLEGDLEA